MKKKINIWTTGSVFKEFFFLVKNVTKIINPHSVYTEKTFYFIQSCLHFKIQVSKLSNKFLL